MSPSWRQTPATSLNREATLTTRKASSEVVMGNTFMTVVPVTSVSISCTSSSWLDSCHKFEQESCTYDTQDIFGGGGGKCTFDTSSSTRQYIMEVVVGSTLLTLVVVHVRISCTSPSWPQTPTTSLNRKAALMTHKTNSEVVVGSALLT